MEQGAADSASVANNQPSTDHRPPEPTVASGGETSPIKSPAELVQAGGPSNLTTASGEPPMRRPLCSHSRSMSLAGAARGGKRLSLSFPIQPYSTANSRHSTSSSTSQTPMTPASPVEADKDAILSPTRDSVGFLVALAANERRVLELREELGRAEGELEKLKRQWAMHEAMKKRGEIRAVEPLRPVSNNLSGRGGGAGVLSREEVENIELWNAEQKRRMAIVNGNLVNSGIKPSTSSHRKVISGQRHTRTLSLLSPDRLRYGQTFPQPADLSVRPHGGPLDNKPELSPSMAPPSSKPSVAPKLPPGSSQASDNITRSRNSFQAPPREALIRTGRQMAEDFKEGLWTFIEDLRQATVGEEGVNAKASRTTTSPGLASTPKGTRKQGSKSNLRGSGRSPSGQVTSPITNSEPSGDGRNKAPADVKESFWKEHGVTTPRKATTRRKSATKKTGLTLYIAEQHRGADDDDDGWENWGSSDMKLPSSPRWSSSTFVHSDGEGVTSESGPEASTNLADGPTTNIPWPSLSDLSPENLKRTASTLIKGLEKQGLASPREKVEQLGVGGGSMSPSTGAGKGKKGD
ncbi:hypothetical protein GP486_002746 [Trichoglossum hirsutum]|uniref:DUF4048 domain-containing protein n=1 Tax=Trichoglossum hirsutum TaxID=265104 RepID=A0A9P8LEN0_9PEZI|nr:hypothetical protein GP486_002746 [Trichoglossum hirsutum]